MTGFAVRNDGTPGWRAVSGIEELYSTEVFSAVEPPKTEAPPPSSEELIAEAKVQRDKLLAIAANRMGPLQDAVDLGRATDAEVALLTQWKGYRVDLNRVEQQESFPVEIHWPLSPDDLPNLEPIDTPPETPDE